MTVTAMEPVRTGTHDRATGGIRTLAEVSTYEQAERIVDRLADAAFPVERVRIVGLDLFGVERIPGRMTKGRATAAGAATGAWVSLLTGLMFAMFSTGAGWPVVLLVGLVVGSLSGAAAGFVAHRATGAARDFPGVRNLRAVRYAVQVEAAHADDAGGILGPR